MDVNTIALFAITEFLMSLTPGPAVLLVIGMSIRHGFRIGFAAILGILSTNAFFFTLSALGVGVLIVASTALFTTLKYIGAAYLIYLGIGMIGPFAKRCWQHRRSHVGLDPAEAWISAPATPPSLPRSFWQGFSLQASNPKNIAFFVAILPQFVTPDGSVVLQLSVLGIVSVLLELPILFFYATASAASARIMKDKIIERIEAVGGGILIALGGALAASRNSP